MKPSDRLLEYLGAIERRLRWLTVTRGAAATAGAALVCTILAVLAANHFAFSSLSVTAARLFLFLGIAFVLAAALLVPAIRLNRRRTARAAERSQPRFEERLLTFAERMEQNADDPFLPLLAADTLPVVEHAAPARIAGARWMFAFSSAALVAAALLIWLGASGPGFLGFGTSLLWADVPKGAAQPFYAIQVEPGNRTIRQGADQAIRARLTGFTAPQVEFFAKYASASQWEQAEMRTAPEGSAYQFVIAGVPESLDYYVRAGGIRSATYRLKVVDLPAVKNIKVTYHYPAWTGMVDAIENPGGDLRAVEGTVAEVAVETSRPLAAGAILLDDGSKLALRSGGGNIAVARVPVQKDGLYHVAVAENGEDVRLSEDYFIEAQKVHPPEVTITRPGRDFPASPIEEVTVAVNARDDFGLRGVELRYAVNGGPEKAISLLQAKGAKSSSGAATLALEDFHVQPGDIVSFYARAQDALQTADTDLFFIEAQPFERNYSQSQQEGGGGEGEQQDQLSERQKEILTATWNQIKGNGAKVSEAENAAFLATMQSKLRGEANSLADRAKARQIEMAGDAFKNFVDDMEKAAAAMAPASDQLRGAHWRTALEPEQKALQYLLRAEATFRDIQVAFGQQGGNGGNGMSGATRDLQGLFDLELDTEKNQYEGIRPAQSADARQRQLDDALEKLKQLAQRQQELAAQQPPARQTSQQRWQQEMLRREAEQLQRQIQQLSGGQAGQSGQMGQPGQGQAGTRQLQQTLDRLQQALQNMRQAASSQQAGTPQGKAEARRATDRLNDATQTLSGLSGAESAGEVDGLVQQANELAQRQQDIEGRLRRGFGPGSPGVTRQQAGELADEKESEADSLKRLEQGMQNAARDLMTTQRPAATRMRQALGDMEQREIERDLDRNAQWIRRGLGDYAVMSEPSITAGLNQLRDNLRQVQKAIGPASEGQAGGEEDQAVREALSRVEQLRQKLEQMAAGKQPGPAAGQLNGGNPRSGGAGSPDGTADAENLRQAYRGALDSLGQLARQAGEDPATARDIQGAMRDLHRVEPGNLGSDPLLASRIQAVLPGLEQVEMELRRQAENAAGETIRTPGANPVPQGYSDAVAEYFRKLSQSK